IQWGLQNNFLHFLPPPFKCFKEWLCHVLNVHEQGRIFYEPVANAFPEALSLNFIQISFVFGKIERDILRIIKHSQGCVSVTDLHGCSFLNVLMLTRYIVLPPTS